MVGVQISPEYRYGAGFDLVRRWVAVDLSLSAKFAYAQNHFNVTDQNNTVGAMLASFRYSFF